MKQFIVRQMILECPSDWTVDSVKKFLRRQVLTDRELDKLKVEEMAATNEVAKLLDLK